MSYEVKYFILKKGERLRGYSLKPSPISEGGVENLVATYCNMKEDIKVECREFGNEKALSIVSEESLTLIYCTRFEVKEE